MATIKANTAGSDARNQYVRHLALLVSIIVESGVNSMHNSSISESFLEKKEKINMVQHTLPALLVMKNGNLYW